MNAIVGRPEFGNPEHIHAVKVLAAQGDFKALPKCKTCDGEGDCSKCGQDCNDCDGTGKDWKALEAWKDANPGVDVWEAMK